MTRKLWWVIGAVFVAHALYLNCVAEDAFITFRFARHFIGGHGLVWNIGEPPVEGYTNFLWLLLCALVLKFQGDPSIATQILGILAGLGTLLFTYRYAQRWLALPGRFAVIPSLFLALSGPFAAWAGSGMETTLFGLLVIAGAYWYVGYQDSGSYGRLALSGATLLLATMTRPEGVLVFGLLGLLTLIFRSSWKRLAAECAVAGLIYLVPMVLYSLWRHDYFGYWLPNTFYAKTGGTLHQYLRGAKYAGLFAAYFVLPLLVPWLFRVGGASARPGAPERRTAKIGLWVCGAISAFYALYIVYVGGDYMAMFRFFVPLLPFIYLLFGVLVHRVWQSTAAPAGRRRVTAALAGCAAATLLFSTPLEPLIFPKPKFMHGCYRGIEIERWHAARLQLIGRFFHDYKQGPHESLAVEPIGAIAYYAEMPVHSITGIVDPHIAHRGKGSRRRKLGQGLPGHEKQDFKHVLGKAPTYILYFKPERNLTPEPRTPVADDAVNQRYRPVSVWLEDAVNHEAGYLSFLELRGARPASEDGELVQKVLPEGG